MRSWRAWRAAGAPPTDVAVLGLTTVPDGSAERDRLAALVAEATGSDRVLDLRRRHHRARGRARRLVGRRPRDRHRRRLRRAGAERHARPSSAATATSSATRAAPSGSAGPASPRLCAPPTAAASAPTSPPSRRTPSATSAPRTSASTPIRAPVDRIARFAPSVHRGRTRRRRRRAAHRRPRRSPSSSRACGRGWAAAGAEPATPLAVIGRLADELRPELDEALAELGDIVDLRPPVGRPARRRRCGSPPDGGRLRHRRSHLDERLT